MLILSVASPGYSPFSINYLLQVVIMLIIVVALAYFSTKWIASAKLINRSNSAINIIDSVGVGINASILLIKVGDQFFLVGLTKERITFLSEVSSENVSSTDIKHDIRPPLFKDVLQSISQYGKKNKQAEGDKGVEDE